MKLINLSFKWSCIMMNSNNNTVSSNSIQFMINGIAGIVIPLSVLCIAISLCCIIRRCRGRNSAYGNYSQVNHALDDEEIEFKRILEKRKTNDTEISGMNQLQYDELNDEDVSFDDSELDTLNQLENYRSNLISQMESHSSSSNSNSYGQINSDIAGNVDGGESTNNDSAIDDEIRV